MKNNHYSKAVASYIKGKQEDLFDEQISGSELAQMSGAELDKGLKNATFRDIIEAVCIKLEDMGVINKDNDKTL